MTGVRTPSQRRSGRPSIWRKPWCRSWFDTCPRELMEHAMKSQCLVALFCVATAIAAAACSANENAAQDFLSSADRYAARDKYQDAIVQYRNAVQRNPRFGAARLK